jgi:hypothetical protein
VKKEILLPVFGIVLLGLIGGNYLVYRVIKKERRYTPVEYGPMDHRPSTGRHPVGMTATNVPATSAPAAVTNRAATQAGPER